MQPEPEELIPGHCDGCNKPGMYDESFLCQKCQTKSALKVEWIEILNQIEEIRENDNRAILMHLKLKKLKNPSSIFPGASEAYSVYAKVSSVELGKLYTKIEYMHTPENILQPKLFWYVNGDSSHTRFVTKKQAAAILLDMIYTAAVRAGIK